MPPKKGNNDKESAKIEENSLEDSIKCLDLNKNIAEEDLNNNQLNESDKHVNTDENESQEKEVDNEDRSEEDDDENGWITPSNLEEVKKMNLNELEEDLTNLSVKVACMTSDFAMQVKNLLKVMWY